MASGAVYENKEEWAIAWLEAIKEKYIRGGDEGFDECRKRAIDIAVETLRKQKPRKGKWYKQLSKNPSAIPVGGSRFNRCSLCGGSGRKSYRFCPHCGAYMEKDGEQDAGCWRHE